MIYYGPDKIDPYKLDHFTRQYLETALWSTNDESNERGGNPMDQNYGIEDIAHSALSAALADCTKFQEDNAEDISAYADQMGRWGQDGISAYQDGLGRAGHDYWLTRNGHGAGFWDRGLGDLGERLTKAAGCKEINLYVSADGKIYQG